MNTDLPIDPNYQKNMRLALFFTLATTFVVQEIMAYPGIFSARPWVWFIFAISLAFGFSHYASKLFNQKQSDLVNTSLLIGLVLVADILFLALYALLIPVLAPHLEHVPSTMVG